VVFNIYLMSIRDRKIISHINFKTPADATLFTKMIELRDRNCPAVSGNSLAV
jgi:hypothetical protein